MTAPATPRLHVRLGMPVTCGGGRWTVWSHGPDPGTWWLVPLDQAARDHAAHPQTTRTNRVVSGCLLAHAKELTR